MLATLNQAAKAPVFVPEADCERLWNLAVESSSPGAFLLRQELERATVVHASLHARRFVRLLSRVEFADLLTGRARTVTLVEPGEAGIDEDRISVLTPVGALMGLRPRHTFSWTMHGSRPRVLAVNNGVDPG